MSNSSKISEYNNNTMDIYNLEPNKLIAMSFNFDILKYVIKELINNQKNSFDEILQIKTELLENKKHTQEIESTLIEMRLLSSNISSRVKSQLEEAKKNLLNQKAELEKEIELLKDKENQSKILSMNNKKNEDSISETKVQEKERKKEKSIETNQSKNESQTIVKDEKDKKVNDKKTNDLLRQIEIISKEMKNLKSNHLYLEKDFIIYRNSIEETISKKVEIYLTKLEEKLLSKFDYIKKSLNENINKNTVNITELKDNYNKTVEEINKNMSDLITKENKDSIALYELITKNNILTTKLNNINESLSAYTKITDFRQYKNDNALMLTEDKKELRNSISTTQINLNNLKNQFLDHINDLTDHNHIQFLLKKNEIIQNNIYALEEFKKTTEEIEKKRIIIDTSKYVLIDSFKEYANTIHKHLDSNKKELTEIRNYLDEVRQKEILNKASLKDLKLLEDSLLMRFGDLKKILSEKYVDKITLNRNTKSIELQTKQMIEENKKNDKSEKWLLAKKAITGHLCASCESEIADLNQDSSKYIFWKKYHSKDLYENKFKIEGGISKILKLIKNNTPDDSIYDKKERYVTNSCNEQSESREKGKSENKSNNILNKSIKNDQDDSDILNNLPKIVKKLRKNNSANNLINPDLNNKSTSIMNKNKNNINAYYKNISQNLSKDYISLNDETKIQLKESIYDNVIGPKITKIYKKH